MFELYSSVLLETVPFFPPQKTPAFKLVPNPPKYLLAVESVAEEVVQLVPSYSSIPA